MTANYIQYCNLRLFYATHAKNVLKTLMLGIHELLSAIINLDPTPMPKFTIELTEEQVRDICCYKNPDCKICNKPKPHDCIFKDDFEFANNSVIVAGYKDGNKAYDKFWALHRIKNYIHDNDMEFVPDWDDLGQIKYCILYSDNREKYDLNFIYGERVVQVDIFFSNDKDAQKVIDNCRADLDILRS